ncbi:probable 28S rRNA (cytosine(4447)-C(5))-methyltransferase [Portunus trituberculatus]|uniref:probable 28S rRNA (cytosine(4447)-C(5))-methyltransferase n=1 Tax=Portunus trituberculatus TaxID=210409 RepID=UPI001E1CE925|nr:probable 28S rRNA (cytosine(4447)-C(5))-methyltransferase [Portunus trituberculatus]
MYGAVGSVGGLAVTALSLSPDAVFLDLCAGRGHHTELAGECVKGEGLVVANCLTRRYLPDVERVVSRCGLTSMLVTRLHLLEMPKSIRGSFTHVLVNTPTTTTGGGGGVGVWFLQQVLEAGVDALVCGGVLVYLTVSARVEDNEEVVEQVRRTRQVEVVPLTPPPHSTDLRFEKSESGCLRVTHLDGGSCGGGGMYCLTKLKKVA